MAIPVSRQDFMSQFGGQQEKPKPAPIRMKRADFMSQFAGVKPTQPEEQGFLSKVGEKLAPRVEAFKAAGDVLGKDTFREKAGTLLGEGILKQAGAVAGGIGDVAGEAISAVVPDFIKEGLSDAGKAIAETELGQAGLSAAGAGVEKYQEWAESNPNASKDLEAVVNIASIVPVGKGAQVAGKGALGAVEGAAGKVVKGIGAKAAKGKGLVGDIATQAVATPTGMSPETVRQILKQPKLFSGKEMAKMDRDSMFGTVKKSVQGAIDEVSETGKAYQPLRESGQVVKFTESPFKKALEKHGLMPDETGKINLTSESSPIKPGDKAAIEQALSLYDKPELSANATLNARKFLTEKSPFDATRSDVGDKILKEMRKDLDNNAKAQLKGLKELDAKFGKQAEGLKGIRNKMFDAQGNIKPGAISFVSNLKGRGKEQALDKMKKIVPDIEEKINVLKAIEDIDLAKGQKVGAYGSNLFAAGGVGFATGNPLAGIMTAVLTSPTMAVPILRGYATATGASKKMLGAITGKLKTGAKLNKEEGEFFKKAVKYRATATRAGVKSKVSGQIEKKKTKLADSTDNEQEMVETSTSIAPEEDRFSQEELNSMSAPVTEIDGIKVSNKVKEAFPFPDFKQSSPGQILRADLKLEGSGDAEIVFNFKDSNGNVFSDDGNNETLSNDKFDYGLELKIPEDASTGEGEVWATINGKEVAGTRVAHGITNGKNRRSDRYKSFKGALK